MLGWQEGAVAGADAGTDNVACLRPAMVEGGRTKVIGTGSCQPTAYRRADDTGDDHPEDPDTNDAGRSAGGSGGVNISDGLRPEEQAGERTKIHGSLCSALLCLPPNYSQLRNGYHSSTPIQEVHDICLFTGRSAPGCRGSRTLSRIFRDMIRNKGFRQDQTSMIFCVML